MPATLEVQSTLTDRYQITVPETVRRALKLGKRDNPVLKQFLGFLARDIANHPERLQFVEASLVQRLQSLVGGVEVDLDAVLSADDE